MIDTTPKELNAPENSKPNGSENSEEFENFENALRDIFSLSPQASKEIRKKKPPKTDDSKEEIS